MDARNIMRFLNEVFKEANPGMVHVLAKLETANVEDTFFITIPDDIAKPTADLIASTIADFPESAKGGYDIKVLHKLNQTFTDAESKAVIKEALNDIANHADGELKFLPTKVAYFLVINTAYPLDEETVAKCKESFALFGADGKFHRVVVRWEEGGEWDVMEFNQNTSKTTVSAIKPTFKASPNNLTKISELDDPARLRTRVIRAEDLTDFKILLGQKLDVNDVIAALDKIGTED